MLKDFIRIKKTFCNPDKFNEEFLPISRIMTISQASGPACTKHALEACILARATGEFIRDQISLDFSDEDLALYKAWYFDVEDNLERAFWMEQYVIVPAAQDHSDSRLSNYVWKVMGYAGGTDELLAGCLHGGTYPEETVTRLRRRCLAAEEKRTLQRAISGPSWESPEAASATHLHFMTKISDLLEDSSGVAAAEGRLAASMLGMGKTLQVLPPGVTLSKTEFVSVGRKGEIDASQQA